VPPLVFAARKKWRALAAWAATAAVTAGLTLAAVGTRGVRAWVELLASAAYVQALHAGRALRMGSVAPLVRSIVPGSAGEMLGVAASVAIAAAMVARVRRAEDERGVWALACLTSLLVTPHLFAYDLALLVLPVGLVLEVRGGLSRAERAALVAFTGLTWTMAARAPLEATVWPVRLLAAAWTAAPMLALWREVPLVGTRSTSLLRG
jgi:hypothetical protein